MTTTTTPAATRVSPTLAELKSAHAAALAAYHAYNDAADFLRDDADDAWADYLLAADASDAAWAAAWSAAAVRDATNKE